MAAAAPIQVLRDPENVTTLLQPGRMRMLELLQEPDSAAGLARTLGMPRQLANYHLKALEQAGLVKEVGNRKKGNCIERLVRASAKSYLVSPEALGKLGDTPAERHDRFSAAYLISAAARIIRDLTALLARARAAGKRISTLTLEAEVRFASAEDRNAFAEELAATLARLAARYHKPEAQHGRTFRWVVAALPAISGHHPDSKEAVLIEEDEQQKGNSA